MFMDTLETGLQIKTGDIPKKNNEQLPLPQLKQPSTELRRHTSSFSGTGLPNEHQTTETRNDLEALQRVYSNFVGGDDSGVQTLIKATTESSSIGWENRMSSMKQNINMPYYDLVGSKPFRSTTLKSEIGPSSDYDSNVGLEMIQAVTDGTQWSLKFS